MNVLNTLLRRRSPVTPYVPEGLIVYAVGDVHGCVELLDGVLERIDEDVAEAAPERTPIIVFLGDYVDRGPASRAVIDRLITLDRTRYRVRCLKGNHEAALLSFLENPRPGHPWLDHGGCETLASYGVDTPAGQSDYAAWRAARDAFHAALPTEHRAFLDTLEVQIVIGSYAFVHAGVRPGVKLEAQREADLLQIRDPFLNDAVPYEKIVVHGHTPETMPRFDGRRVGVDTGAYLSGVLTAARLEGDTVRFLQAVSAQLVR